MHCLAKPITVSPIAFMVPAAVDQFDRVWTSLGDSAETSRAKFNLDVPDIATTLAKVIAASGMAPCEGSHMPDDGARAHMFMLSGVYCGKSKVLVRAQASPPCCRGRRPMRAVRLPLTLCHVVFPNSCW